jgi:hypothetical protein
MIERFEDEDLPISFSLSKSIRSEGLAFISSKMGLN